MMRAGILGGVSRGWLSLDSGDGKIYIIFMVNCRYTYCTIGDEPLISS